MQFNSNIIFNSSFPWVISCCFLFQRKAKNCTLVRYHTKESMCLAIVYWWHSCCCCHCSLLKLSIDLWQELNLIRTVLHILLNALKKVCNHISHLSARVINKKGFNAHLWILFASSTCSTPEQNEKPIVKQSDPNQSKIHAKIFTWKNYWTWK